MADDAPAVLAPAVLTPTASQADPRSVIASASASAPDPNMNLKILLLLLPKVPLIARVAILHVLRLSKPAKYLDLQSELVVAVLRSLFHPSSPHAITQVQKLTTQNSTIKGRIWISSYTSPPPPENGARDALARALESMRDPTLPEPRIRVPAFSNVEAEWTGYRVAASRSDPLPKISERARYQEMMKDDCKQPTTVLFFHGGAYYLCDPATHRPTTKKLAKLTGGRCYSVRYRLAPQHPFPSALLDAFVSYLTLLFPPPEAYHEPVKPEHIVFSGDSAGGNLALALLQLVLELRRLDFRVQWYGKAREMPLPAGVACNSPWLDITHSSPSWDGDDMHMFDYLPKPQAVRLDKAPVCNAWPANPPRKHIYGEDDIIAHPLSSVVMSPSWEGSPPVYICTGWELLAREDKYLAKKLVSEGVNVVFEEYEAMPHCFAMLLTTLPNSRRCFKGWANFISDAVRDPGLIKSHAVTIKSKSLEEIPVAFEDLNSDRHEEVHSRIITKLGLKTQGQPEVSAKL